VIDRKQILLFILIMVGFIPLQAQQRGKATFYSRRATGARTSSGERLHHDSMTCAHRKYPFGTLLKVTNLSNGKEVVVRVTDRGPFGRGRIIDLSWGAAKQLDMLSKGVVMVEVVPVTSRPVPFRNDDTLKVPRVEFDMVEGFYTRKDSVAKNETEKQLTETPKKPKSVKQRASIKKRKKKVSKHSKSVSKRSKTAQSAKRKTRRTR
jgi:rare lipoprotein A